MFGVGGKWMHDGIYWKSCPSVGGQGRVLGAGLDSVPPQCPVEEGQMGMAPACPPVPSLAVCASGDRAVGLTPGQERSVPKPALGLGGDTAGSQARTGLFTFSAAINCLCVLAW